MSKIKYLDSMAKIKVIGVGGGGNNVVNRIVKDKVQNIETYALNTEINILKKANTKNVLQIGKQTTRGLGAGANEKVGEKAAIESEDDIRKILENTDMVFLTAGMGGRTGTGAIPVIAELAKEMDILTVGIVTMPFTFEGKRRRIRAERGIEKLKDNVDALIVIFNDNLLKVIDDKTSINESFAMVDNVLKKGIQSITDLITAVGEIYVDFENIETIFKYKGKTCMGIASASGENRIKKAVKEVIDNPLTENSIDNAKGVIFNVTGGENLELSDVNESIMIINDRICKDANVQLGIVFDPELKDTAVVTIIATGIE